jgi:hypothetical protein
MLMINMHDRELKIKTNAWVSFRRGLQRGVLVRPVTIRIGLR